MVLCWWSVAICIFSIKLLQTTNKLKQSIGYTTIKAHLIICHSYYLFFKSNTIQASLLIFISSGGSHTLKRNILEHLQSNRTKYLLVTVMFLIGVAAGIAMYQLISDQTRSQLLKSLDSFFTHTAMQGQSLDRTSYFKKNLESELRSFAIMWICGLTVLGLVAAPFFSLLKGFTIGFTNTFIIANYGTKGVFYSLLTIIPQNLIKIPALFFCCVCIMSYSLKLTESKSKSKGVYLGRASPFKLFVLFTIMVTISFLISLVGVALESYITPSFIFVFTPEMHN